MPWNVADVLSLDGGYFSYCGWALYVDGWLGNAKIRNVWSYLNADGLLFKSGTVGQYDWNLADLTSQVCTTDNKLRRFCLFWFLFSFRVDVCFLQM